MDKVALERITATVLLRRERITYVKLEMDEAVHEISYALVDDEDAHVLRFETAEDSMAVWGELVLDLAGGHQPLCGCFLFITLLSLTHFIGPELVNTPEGNFLYLQFRGENSLAFKYPDEVKRQHDFVLLKQFFGLLQNSAKQTLN